MFRIIQISKPQLKNPILIEGLPGIGNVGKICVDFMIDNLEAKKFLEIYSTYFPSSVFVNENNLVDLPKMEFFYKRLKNQDLILLSGDVQPIEEVGCYELCNKILDIFKKVKGKEIITLGGIGLSKIPPDPKVYCTANNKNIIKKYKTQNLNTKIFGVVGPIIGMTGLLIGLAEQRKIPAITLLAQTFAHPTYIGIKGSREILEILDKKLNLNLDLNSLNKEIKNIEREIKLKTQQFTTFKKKDKKQETSYIG
ncbi:MAG: PAC2 family protein [Nanoarchaeota archaeon]|nr:PAC2 family protein [Nanoarchaeota archaeon]